MNQKGRTLDAAHGRWREILLEFNVPATVLNGKHHPCPSCGGKDRFRFHDRDCDGDYYCAGCGAGKGIRLVANVNGWEYAEAAKRVDEFIGNRPEPKTKPACETKKIDTRAAALKLWKTGQPIESGDPAWLYLYSRGLKVSTDALRYTSALYHTDTKSEHPGMLAKISDVQGNGQSLHRTYLTKDGSKAAVEKCRKMMPGEFPKGGAVRLSPAAEVMGVAEGIETALSASALTGLPVWSTISEGLLQTWVPPVEAKEVIIFADNDLNFVGQHAAHALAKRLSLETDLIITVSIPECPGTDWNDVLLRQTGEVNARAA